MSNINISLPESMKAFIEEQVAEGGYGSVSGYLQELITQDQKRKMQEHIEQLLIAFRTGMIMFILLNTEQKSLTR